MSLVASLDWRLARQGQRQLPDFAGGRRFLSRKPEDRPAAEPADRCGRLARPLRTARVSKEESRATPFSIKTVLSAQTARILEQVIEGYRAVLRQDADATEVDTITYPRKAPTRIWR